MVFPADCRPVCYFRICVGCHFPHWPKPGMYYIYPRELLGCFLRAFAIGLANAVVALMNQAQILDTLVYHMSGFLNGKSSAIVDAAHLFMYSSRCLTFSLYPAAAKRLLLCPYFSLWEIFYILISRSLFWPISMATALPIVSGRGSAMVGLSMCNLGYGEWIRFCWKIYVSMMVAAFVLVIIANAIGYGPF